RDLICERCKERPATVVVTKNYMGEPFERHLCEHCAFHAEEQEQVNEELLSIQQFLSHLSSDGKSFLTKQQQQPTAKTALTCPSCALSFEEFLNIGKFGCPTCYETFRMRLPQVLGKLHSGQSTHIGKVPSSFNQLFALKRQIEEARMKMQQAVTEERFEDAAHYRDDAKRLQQLLDDGGDAPHVD